MSSNDSDTLNMEISELSSELVGIPESNGSKKRKSSGTSTQPLKTNKIISIGPKTSRSLRACDLCRKLKTRCLPCQDSLACLRCKNLGYLCSLQNIDDFVDGQGRNGPAIPATSRLDRLESTVGEILSILRNETTLDRPTPLFGAGKAGAAIAKSYDEGSGRSHDKRELSPSAGRSSSERPVVRRDVLDPLSSENSFSGFGNPSQSFQLSPMNIFGSISSSPNHLLPITRLYNPQMVVQEQDIISLGVITEEEALDLLKYFRTNYNRWVSFPEDIEIETLMDRIRKRCSLLLSVCCCVVIRYYKKDHYSSRYKLLLRKMQNELTQSLTVVPQTIEFMQALALVAIYATSLSEGDIVFDGWFYSSVALQHFITKDILGLVMSFDGIGPVTEFDEIMAYRVWNHLCLVHLVSCVLSGRMCILDEIRLDQCRRTLQLSSATNFDGRMVAEISLQLIVYSYVETPQSLEAVTDDLKEWLDEWGYLFEQPIIQFVESGFHFGYFCVLLHWAQFKWLQTQGREKDGEQTNELDPLMSLKTDQLISIIDEKLFKQMIGHLQKVVDSLLIVKSNTYFSCLSDQVFFHSSFAAIMIGKLLKGLQAQGRGNECSKAFVEMLKSKIMRVASRFRTIAMDHDDVAIKYSNAIIESAAGL